MQEKKERLLGLDVIRCIAFASVVGWHFFYITGFDNIGLEEWPIFAALCVRTFFLICVPLFMMLTGFLLRKKTFSGRYYLKLTRVLVIYVLCSIPGYVEYIMAAHGSLQYSALDFMKMVLSFQAARYSWYIEMYVGLYLLAPVLNALCEAMKKKSGYLIGTVLVVFAVPSLLNIRMKILPEYFTDMYPIMYYIIGWFIAEKRPKMNKALNCALILLTTLISSAVIFAASTPFQMSKGVFTKHAGAPAAALSVLVFLLLYDIQLERLPQWACRGIAWISRLTLPAYLLSSVVDDWAYAPLMKSTEYIRQRIRLKYFVQIVPKVLAISLLMAAVVDGLYTLGAFAVGKAMQKARLQNQKTIDHEKE